MTRLSAQPATNLHKLETKEDMKLDSVQSLTMGNILSERAIRKASTKVREFYNQLETCLNDDAIKGKGIRHIDSAVLRVRVAKALEGLEQAHALLCENHKEFNELADTHGLYNPGPEISAKDGGGR